MNPLEAAFPNLTTTGYRITSPSTADYNCIAWAAGESDRWWWPDAAGTAYWPPGVAREETVSAFLGAFQAIGFELTPDDRLEPGVDKVALMATAGKPTHMLRQLPNGRWTSKLGQSEDIEHDIAALVGTIYGDVVHILRRPAGAVTSPPAR